MSLWRRNRVPRARVRAPGRAPKAQQLSPVTSATPSHAYITALHLRGIHAAIRRDVSHALLKSELLWFTMAPPLEAALLGRPGAMVEDNYSTDAYSTFMGGVDRPLPGVQVTATTSSSPSTPETLFCQVLLGAGHRHARSCNSSEPLKDTELVCRCKRFRLSPRRCTPL